MTGLQSLGTIFIGGIPMKPFQLLSAALITALAAAPAHAEIFKIAHKDIDTGRNHIVHYFCLEPQDIPAEFADTARYKLSPNPRKPNQAFGFVIGSWPYTVLLTEVSCLDEVMASILKIEKFTETDFTITSVAN